MTDEGVGKLVAGFQQLSSLSCGGCSKVIAKGVGKLAAGCQQLSSLNLWLCSEVTDGGVGKLAAGCPHFPSLGLDCFSEVTDEGVGKLAAGCLCLSSLSLGSCPKVTFWLSLHLWPPGCYGADGTCYRAWVEEVPREMPEEEQEYRKRHGGACCLLWMRAGKPEDGELEQQLEWEHQRQKQIRRNWRGGGGSWGLVGRTQGG